MVGRPPTNHLPTFVPISFNILPTTAWSQFLYLGINLGLCVRPKQVRPFRSLALAKNLNDWKRIWFHWYVMFNKWPRRLQYFSKFNYTWTTSVVIPIHGCCEQNYILGSLNCLNSSKSFVWCKMFKILPRNREDEQVGPFPPGECKPLSTLCPPAVPEWRW